MRWSTKKQNFVTLSPIETELVALCSSVSGELWLKKLMPHFDLNVEKIVLKITTETCHLLIILEMSEELSIWK